MIEIAKPNLAKDFHRSIGSRAKKKAIGIEIARKINWRKTIAMDEPLVSRE
jgi:hypothetical protein